MANEPKDRPVGLGDLARILANLRSEGPDPQPGPLERALMAPLFTELPAPPVVQKRWFKDQTIRIDGYTFEQCRFDRCKLVTEMATFTFKGCFISPDCGVYFVGPALKVARLLMHTLRVKGRIREVEGEEGVYARLNSDGTFSLESE